MKKTVYLLAIASGMFACNTAVSDGPGEIVFPPSDAVEREPAPEASGIAETPAIPVHAEGIIVVRDSGIQLAPTQSTPPPPPPIPETHSDGIKNAGETGVDCGGLAPNKCPLTGGCAKHADCVSDACSYDGKCIADKSCTGHSGGDTCGVGETGTPGAKHVSCCETAPLFGNLANVEMDRFLITAGRMRTFIERVGGDVRSFVHTLPSDKWSASWDDKLVPSSLAEADVQLGSYFNKKSCHPGDYTGRTYWTPPTPDDFSSFDQNQLDEKALNCVTWELVNAFCLWDNKRLATSAEIRNAFTEDGKYVQPWLWQPGAVQYFQPTNFVSPAPWTETFNHAFNYGYPTTNVRANMNLDAAFHVSPPGRYPQSWNEHGHEVAGNLLEWSATGPGIYAATFSWENHNSADTDGDWRAFEATPTEPGLSAGYYAIGGRCAR